MQHIDFGDNRNWHDLLAFGPPAVHQHRQAGVTDGPLPPGSRSPHRLHPRFTLRPVLLIPQQQRRPLLWISEFAMRLLFATIAAALAALSGDVVQFEGLSPTR